MIDPVPLGGGRYAIMRGEYRQLEECLRSFDGADITDPAQFAQDIAAAVQALFPPGFQVIGVFDLSKQKADLRIHDKHGRRVHLITNW